MNTTQTVIDKTEASSLLFDRLGARQEEERVVSSARHALPESGKIKILLDLKPALDGFAGIPQEARLLFRGLRMMPGNYDVEGLIQHGGRRLRSAVSPKGNALSTSAKINRLSRVVVSLYE